MAFFYQFVQAAVDMRCFFEIYQASAILISLAKVLIIHSKSGTAPYATSNYLVFYGAYYCRGKEKKEYAAVISAAQGKNQLSRHYYLSTMMAIGIIFILAVGIPSLAPFRDMKRHGIISH